MVCLDPISQGFPSVSPNIPFILIGQIIVIKFQVSLQNFSALGGVLFLLIELKQFANIFF